MPTAGRLGPKTVMNNIHVKLPEGKTVEVSPGLKIQDFMSTLKLNGTVIAAKLDGLPVDLDRSLSEDCTLDWIPLNSPEGLSILRHSTAHLLAQAVQSLFPGTQVTIGPTLEDGFSLGQARSSVGERFLDTEEAGGSIPPVPTIF